MKKGHWLNTTTVIYPDIEKPCIKLRYCPYGTLVEEYPLYHMDDYPNKEHGEKLACLSKNNNGLMQFGHDCPVHYHAEYLAQTQDGKPALAAVSVGEG